MEQPRFRVADVVRRHGDAFLASHEGRTTPDQRRALRAIALCRTAALGGHVETYACGHEVTAYNSCRNRNCPRCLAHKSREWVEARERELLPVPYFHVVFTLPQELAHVARVHPRVVYELLMQASAATLLDVARRRLGARIGFLSVLHTWGQTLTLHPHVHCVVPSGGFSEDGASWIRGRARFLLPVRVLSVVFRGKMIAGLKRAHRRGKLPSLDNAALRVLVAQIAAKPWVVYAKPPFGAPEQVLRYLARFTHRIAIGDHRLQHVDDQTVRFSYKDYRRGNATRSMTLSGAEFLRRFVDHVVPRGFTRIRSFGYLAHSCKTKQLALARTMLGAKFAAKKTADASAAHGVGVMAHVCPVCGAGPRLFRTPISARGPPT